MLLLHHAGLNPRPSAWQTSTHRTNRSLFGSQVRELRSRLSASEKNVEAFRVKYKSIRKSALGYKKLAAEREKRLAEEKEAHKAHLDDIQIKMAKTIHKREAEINAKIAEIEKSNNEKLKVIMMLQRTAESGTGMNNASGKNNVRNSVKYSDNLSGKVKKKNEEEPVLNGEVEKSNNVKVVNKVGNGKNGNASSGKVGNSNNNDANVKGSNGANSKDGNGTNSKEGMNQKVVNGASNKVANKDNNKASNGNNSGKVGNGSTNNKVGNGTNNDRKVVVLKKKKTEL